MDKPAIHAAEAFVHAGYPLDVEALLIIELDGPERRGRRTDQARRGDRARLRLDHLPDFQFGGRAQSVLGRPQGGVSGGRADLAGLSLHGRHHSARRAAARRWRASATSRRNTASRVANVFHAGDGNLHPLILYDANKPGEMERAEAFGADILRCCVELGGVLTGEHGVGIEKRDLMPEMFSEIDLNQQQRLKCAFDAQGLLNPGKVFPTLHRCAELGRVHVHGGKLAFPNSAVLMGHPFRRHTPRSGVSSIPRCSAYRAAILDRPHSRTMTTRASDRGHSEST